MAHSKLIAECLQCGDAYCMECSDAVVWRKYCSLKCEAEDKKACQWKSNIRAAIDYAISQESVQAEGGMSGT